MYNIGEMKFKTITDGRGILTPIESESDVPFSIKRVYYLTDVGENVMRGRHSHKNLHQVLICVNGSVKVKVENTIESKEFLLDRPDVGLYIGPLVWREMYEFSKGAVLLVLASDFYDEADYIREYDEFMREAKKLFHG